MDEIRRCPICGEKATTMYGFEYDDWWWEHSCSDKDKTFGVNIYGSTSHGTEEGAIKDWNDFCETLVTLYADGHRDGYIDGYIKGYDDGYEKGWQAND